MKNKIILIVVLLFAVMQIFQIDEVSYEQPDENDFFATEQPDEEISALIMNICYDCHSNQVKYPWYSKIAPMSWYVNDHILEGREHLNFSIWKSYESDKKAHKAEECWEEVGEGEMPLTSYSLMHSDARLSSDEKDKLVAYFKSLEQRHRL